MTEKNRLSLHSWYLVNRRPLPWRGIKDPYKIWISETMLQQTTSTAVIPFYKAFISALPDLKSLAEASESQVLELWTGLGYYSRAKNLLKSARLIYDGKTFPRRAEELLDLPGFGPYTARAVSSIAFGESVGVLDGNVIRLLTRMFAIPTEWWKTAPRRVLQQLSDQCVVGYSSGEMNQALMELGGQVCLPVSPKCILCPWKTSCKARKNGQIETLPMKRPKRVRENWKWEVHLIKRKGKILLVRNSYAPFLKGQWLLPGQALRLKAKLKECSFTHSITHHNIQCVVKKSSLRVWSEEMGVELSRNIESIWVDPDKVSGIAPSSLITKACNWRQ